jgi:hypothetical protein
VVGVVTSGVARTTGGEGGQTTAAAAGESNTGNPPDMMALLPWQATGEKGDEDPEETNKLEEATGEAVAGGVAGGKPARTTVWARARRDVIVEGLGAAAGKAA